MGVKLYVPPEPRRLGAAVAPAADGGTEQNALTLTLRAVVAITFEDAWFEFDSSFLLPEARRPFQRFSELRREHPDAPLALFGHADPTGSADYNKKLSGRRARAVYGTLVRDPKVWEALYQEPLGSDNWQGRPVQQMLLALGHDPGPIDGAVSGPRTKEAIKAFQSSSQLPATGTLNPTTRAELFKAYMDLLCRDWEDKPYKLELKDFLARGADGKQRVDLQGCSEFNPTVVFSHTEAQQLEQPSQRARRNLENAPNRRVTLHLFEPRTVVEPGRWPCPAYDAGIGNCKTRFWSDGETRLAPGAKRRVETETHDTYGCRFYERITLTAPPIGESTMPQRLRAHWSRYEVVAAHNSTFPPATPPTDTLPAECQVELLVDTEGVDDGAPARLQVMHAASRAVVPDAAFKDLVVRGGKVVVPATGKPPVWSPTARQLPWELWDKPFFYFVAIVGDLAGESPRDYAADPAQVLRVRWLFNLVADQLADLGHTPLTTQDEINELSGVIGKNPSTATSKTVIGQPRIKNSDWGSLLRDCYTYHHTSHGVVRCLRCGGLIEHPPPSPGAPPPSQPGTPPPPAPRGVDLFVQLACTCGSNSLAGESAIALDDGTQLLGKTEMADAAEVPCTPRYLAYLNCCLCAWEPSLAEALIGRGTQNVIAFAASIDDTQSRMMARRFYGTWVDMYKCDPGKIAEVFFKVAPPFWESMRPRLFGAGGGPAGTDEATNAAIADALGG